MNDTVVKALTERLAWKRDRLRCLEDDTTFFGTVEPGSTLPSIQVATLDRINELRADIATLELALNEFERVTAAAKGNFQAAVPHVNDSEDLKRSG
jgi:hypothetical protein